jgi:glycosyltransferase involved in cell wall biosynthesis
MKVSIITPTHRPKFLNELYESICEQTYTNWEWILYLNGKVRKDSISIAIRNDKKVKIFTDIPCDKSSNVGYIKNRAFHLGKGDILLEADHDDVLLPECLTEVVKAYKKNPEVGFVWSDNLFMKDDFTPYDPSQGWTWYEKEYKGKTYKVMEGFEADAGTMSLIFYAPDHVRTWKRKVYKETGGHDVDRSILDDQDLMIRTYMITKFHHIPKCLYVYRVHGDNTWLERNQQIQDGTQVLFNEWQQRLAERDADLKGLRKLDLGGGIPGTDKRGYEVVDIKNGDINADLNKTWPFEDNSVGVVNASHLFEHLVDKHFSMTELHRVLADKAWAFIEVPSTDGRGAFQDPTHVSYWNQNCFFYYTRAEQAKFIYNDTAKYQARALDTRFYNDWMKENDIPCTRAWLRAIKSDSKIPGQILI